MDRAVVRSIEWLPLEFVCENGNRAVMLVADDPARVVLEGYLAPFPVEGVAVRKVGGIPKYTDMAVIHEPTILKIVRDIAPHKVTTYAVPCRPFRPQHPGVDALDRSVADLIL